MKALLACALALLTCGCDGGFHQAAKECQALENKQACLACATKLVGEGDGAKENAELICEGVDARPTRTAVPNVRSP